MSVMIDRAKCIGCGRCTDACPGNLLILSEDGKARIREVRDCWGCTACMKNCPVSAISFFLGADIGGNGSHMSVKRDGFLYKWTVKLPDGTDKIIDVDSRSSNAY